MNEMRVVCTFEIPDELARDLSELLTRQTIRERLLDRMAQAGDQAGYEMAEEKLMPITEKIDVIKNEITNNYVPIPYATSDYSWNYNGYAISGNKVDVLEKIR